MARINFPNMGITGEEWPDLDGMAPHLWKNHIRTKLQERQAEAAKVAPGGYTGPTPMPNPIGLPSQAPAPGADFTAMLAQIQKSAPAPALPRPGGGIGDMIARAMAPSSGQQGIDVPIKAGMTPDQVTAVNQQLLGEQELAARTEQADRESARQDQTAAMQVQEMDMNRQMQQMKLAEMMMPKENIQVAPDGTVINLGSGMVGTKLAPAPLTADQLADQEYRNQTLALSERELVANTEYRNKTLAQDAEQHSASLAASRASSGAGTKDWNFSEKYGVFVNERTGEWKEAPGLPMATETPEAAEKYSQAWSTASKQTAPDFENALSPDDLRKIEGMFPADLQGREALKANQVQAFLQKSNPAKYNELMAFTEKRTQDIMHKQGVNFGPEATGPQIDPATGLAVENENLDDDGTIGNRGPEMAATNTIAKLLGVDPAALLEKGTSIYKVFSAKQQLEKNAELLRRQNGLPVAPSMSQLGATNKRAVGPSATERAFMGN